MRETAQVQLLPDGRRLHLQHGPIDLIVGADAPRHHVATAFDAAVRRFLPILDELCSELPLLRSRVSSTLCRPHGVIAQRMFDSVLPYSREHFITPMAAVAGSVADAVLESMIKAAPLTRAYVNNGGDIALHLAEENQYTIGIIERPDRPSLFGSLDLSADLPIRGLATSGWRGRSFSLGIADAVTALANTASAADAAATIIANAVDLPGHPAVTRISAREIAPDSDLGSLPVTREVGPLSAHEIEIALDAGVEIAESLRHRGLIHSAALNLQGNTRVVCAPIASNLFAVPQRSLLHA